MLFRNSFHSQQLTTGDWTGLAQLLGVPVAGLGPVDGSASLKEITVYTCIKILSETLGKLPLKIYQSDGGNSQKAVNDYRYPLLKLRPNPYMSAFDFWKTNETNRNIHGNAYVYIDAATSGRNAGKIMGLYPLKSENMTVYVDDMGLLTSKNKVWYKYRDDMGNEYLINSDSVLHFKGMTLNGLIGLSTIEYLRLTIENAKGSTTYLNNSYKKGMQSAGVLQYTGHLDDDGRKKLQNEFETMSSGLVNANRVSVMPLGMNYQPLALKNTDAQFLENTRLTIQQLTAAFGIKPHQVNDQTKTSYASTAEANREFYTDTLLAVLTNYEQEMDYKLFTQKEIGSGLYVKFNADVILRADAQKRYIMYAQGVQNGILTPNECRAMEENPAKPGGDTLLGNAALAPIELIAQGKTYKGSDKSNGESP